MRKHLTSVLKYFVFFSYAPSFEEIYLFFPVKITRKNLTELLMQEYKQGLLLRLPHKHGFSPFPGSAIPYPLIPNPFRYTLPQYSIRRQSTVNSQQSKNIDRRIQTYISFLKWLPLVRFVAVTGKSAVEGVRKNDDIDLFIVTKRGLIWTTRFFVVVFAKLLGIHGKNGVCLNLFFDEVDLSIPQNKRNLYIAHELLQMKPIVSKGTIYSALLEVNRWIFKIFPNAAGRIAKRKTQNVKPRLKTLHATRYTLHEHIFKSMQLPIITKNKTGFRITPTQLWLFKRDFEMKLKKKGPLK